MYQLADLLHLMARLRDPQHGCPWDLQQDYASIVPHTLEEAYEVADAIERRDFVHLPGELGDLLFQVVYYSQLAREEGRFDFATVVDAITRKLVRRHPHVFPDGDLYGSPELPRLDEAAIKQRWEQIKPKNVPSRPPHRSSFPCSTTCPTRCRRSVERQSCRSAPPASASTGRKRCRWSTSCTRN